MDTKEQDRLVFYFNFLKWRDSLLTETKSLCSKKATHISWSRFVFHIYIYIKLPQMNKLRFNKLEATY